MMHIISKVTGVPLQRMEQKETRKASQDGRGTEEQSDRAGRSGDRDFAKRCDVPGPI